MWAPRRTAIIRVTAPTPAPVAQSSPQAFRMTFSSQARGLELLLTLGRELLAVRDLDDLLATALSAVLNYTGYDSGSILLYHTDCRRLEVRASAGADAVPVGTIVPNLQRSIAGYVLTRGEPVVLKGRAEILGTDWRDYTRDIPAVVCLPMLLAEHLPIGVISLKSTLEARELDPETLGTLELIAAQLAATIENARLHVEREELLRSLAEREDQLEQLIGQLITAQEEERRRVAYDLHDGLAQVAAGAYQHLQALAARYSPRSPGARFELQQALELSRRTVREARSVMASLRPTALDDLGLAVALRCEVESLCERGWEVSFDEPSPIGRLPGPVETAIFRVAQEALANVRKHAGPTRVAVTLSQSDHCITLDVRDWGVGFAPGERSRQRRRGEQMGLIGLHERISLIGGSCVVSSVPGYGTVVTATVPLSQP